MIFTCFAVCLQNSQFADSLLRTVQNVSHDDRIRFAARLGNKFKASPQLADVITHLRTVRTTPLLCSIVFDVLGVWCAVFGVP